jgi:polysaccharide export outer membrane protein
MTSIIRAAIVFILGAVMSAQAGEISSPSFDASGCANSVFFRCVERNPPPVSQERVSTTPRQKTASPKTDPRSEQAAETLTSGATPGDAAYRIGPMDSLQISVFNVPQLTQSVQVSAAGTINLPLLGEVPAARKTAQELERDLTSLLGASYLQNPQVTVTVQNYNSQRVIVTGGIKKPGVYPLTGRTSLLQVVALAGGFDASSDSTVLIIRQTGGKRSAARVDVDKIEEGHAEDPVLQEGDTVVAGTSAIKRGFGAFMSVFPLARYGLGWVLIP